MNDMSSFSHDRPPRDKEDDPLASLIGRDLSSVALLSQAAQLRPKDAAVYYALAREGELSQALQHSRQACELVPTNDSYSGLPLS